MILIFNANLSKKSVKNFDVKIAPFITKNRKYETIYIDDKKGILFSKSPNLMKKYTHLLITGSALSASQGSEYDQIFINIINYFVNNNKAVLGICYGHQMIARAILGDSACRRTKIPEFSWRQINIIENHLFEGILNPVIIESHYDEVCNLTDDFEVIASNEDCEIQAFQYKQKPVWGLQFHPEQDYENGNMMIDSHLKRTPEDRKFYRNELENKKQVEQNIKIFDNFFGS